MVPTKKIGTTGILASRINLKEPVFHSQSVISSDPLYFVATSLAGKRPTEKPSAIQSKDLWVPPNFLFFSFTPLLVKSLKKLSKIKKNRQSGRKLSNIDIEEKILLGEIILSFVMQMFCSERNRVFPQQFHTCCIPQDK